MAINEISTPSPPHTKGNRYEFVDIWRGIACLTIVFSHAGNEIIHRMPELASLVVYKLSHLSYLRVPMFFVISGYCIASSARFRLPRSYASWGFVVSRIRRIFPPFWLSLLLYLGVKTTISHLNPGGLFGAIDSEGESITREGWFYYFANFTLINFVVHVDFISGVCWTLCYEIAFYLIVAIAILFARRNIVRLFIALHVLTALCIAFALVEPSLLGYPFDLWPQFGLGVLAYDLAARHNIRRLGPWMCLAVGSILVFALLPDVRESTRMYRWNSIVALAGALLIGLMHGLRWQGNGGPIGRIFAKLGRMSYSLYLIHYFVIAVVIKLLGKRALESSHYLTLLALIATPILVVPFFYYFCERPFMSSRQKGSSSPAKVDDANSINQFGSGLRPAEEP